MPNPTLAQMGFLDEDTQQEVVYDIEDSEARSDISALENKIGSANGIAELDGNGLVPASQLPSYVDDVLEGTAQNVTETAAGTFAATGFILKGELLPCTPEDGKTYVDTTSNIQYRWTGSGTNFVSMGSNLTLGETANTAYAGNKGKANADAIAAMKDGSSIDSFGDVETALANKVDKVQGKGLSTNDYDNTAKNIVDNIQDKVTDVYEVIGKNGAKNLLPFVMGLRNIGGSGLYMDDNGYISAKSNSLLDDRSWVYDKCNFIIPLKAGEYKLRIEAQTQATSVAGICLILSDDTKIYQKDTPALINAELNKDISITLSTDTELGVMYKVGNGAYRFSLRHAEDTDISWTPFAYKNKEITDDYFGASANDIVGAKNLLDLSDFTTITLSSGATISADGYKITINGTTSEGETTLVMKELTEDILPKGKYKMCVRKDTSTTHVVFDGIANTSPDKYLFNVVGAGLDARADYDEQEFTVDYDGYTKIYFDIHIDRDNYTYDNDVVSVMIKPASDNSKEFVPYAMTNKQLTDAVNQGGSGTTVVPNPSGTATGDLNKVQIGNDIYDIPDTTYNVVSKTANGLAPQLPNESATDKYLRQDGTWVKPPNTEYLDATTSASGLMSSTDKAKLNGVADNANNYSLPTAASGTKGGIKVGDGLAISNEILSNPSNVFSTSEKVIGKWINGETLYQKVVDTGQFPNSTSKSVNTGLTNVTIRAIVCVGINSSGGAQAPLPYQSASGWINLQTGSWGSTINIASNFNANFCDKSYAIIKYTKNS